ncbi:MAG: dihydropteroate synthase [Paracoccus sp. (in: a-proteobacteria)]
MTTYWRPIPEEGGQLPLAGGWVRFSRIEMLERGVAPQVLPADRAPPEVLQVLTAPRRSICGLRMNRPSIMGIINATPDSFSDGGLYDGVRQGRAMIAEGADLLDIGGESTRPGAADVAVDDEAGRVVPVIEALYDSGVPISVDTRKAGVAQAAVQAGAGLINDVSGFDHDPDLASLVAGAGLPVCLMHAQGVPATMQDDPYYDDVLLDVYDALSARVERAESAGILRSRILVDPGIGFGKTVTHNVAILERISLFHGLGCPVLLGVSRKRFIGKLAGVEAPRDRAPGTLALTLAAVSQGIQVHRVHDVATMVQGLALWQAVCERAEQ